MTLAEADQKRRVAESERRVAEANRRVAACRAIERRAEEVAQAEQYVAEAERRADEAERRVAPNLASKAAASVVARPSQPKPITAPAPTLAQRHIPKGFSVMSTRKQAILRDLESASARLASARQGLEDAKYLYRAGMASDPVFAAHVVAGAENEWNLACAAYYLGFKG